MLLLSYYDKSYNIIDDIGADKSHWAMSNDSVLWRERTILLLLWIYVLLLYLFSPSLEEAFVIQKQEVA